MPLPENFWLIFILNLPVVTLFFFSLQKKWIVMGETFIRELAQKDKEIAFREQLRQEALIDRAALFERDKEKTEALRELTDVVKQTLDLNDRLLNDNLIQGWDGSDRRQTRSNPRER